MSGSLLCMRNPASATCSNIEDTRDLVQLPGYFLWTSNSPSVSELSVNMLDIRLTPLSSSEARGSGFSPCGRGAAKDVTTRADHHLVNGQKKLKKRAMSHSLDVNSSEAKRENFILLSS